MPSLKWSLAPAALLVSVTNAAHSLNANGHCTTNNNIFEVTVDLFAGNTGYFHVEGCGLQPIFAIVEDQTYTFQQIDPTNWLHPLGFAYGPDGALAVQDELERVVVPPTNPTSTCATDHTCPAPQYMLNNVALTSDPADPEDFGLDEYEGVYFAGDRDTWLGAGNFTVDVRIPSSQMITEFFYFCHIHIGMSQRAVVYSDATTPKVTANPIAIPYTYDFDIDGGITQFDTDCGTFDVEKYLDACPNQVFLCDDDKPFENPTGVPACFQAISCAMHEEMRVNTEENQDPMVLFINQMIPHHRNAVNMAKILLTANPASLDLPTAYGDGGELRTMMYEIINGQNKQITLMQNWLRDNNHPDVLSSICELPPNINAAAQAELPLLVGGALVLTALLL